MRTSWGKASRGVYPSWPSPRRGLQCPRLAYSSTCGGRIKVLLIPRWSFLREGGLQRSALAVLQLSSAPAEGRWKFFHPLPAPSSGEADSGMSPRWPPAHLCACGGRGGWSSQPLWASSPGNREPWDEPLLASRSPAQGWALAGLRFTCTPAEGRGDLLGSSGLYFRVDDLRVRSVLALAVMSGGVLFPWPMVPLHCPRSFA